LFFSSLDGYLYIFNMFRWDAHLVVTYSTNCRGVPLPFHCIVNVYVCVCVFMCTYILLLCLYSKLFPLDIADGKVTVFSQLIIHHHHHTRKWNFFFKLKTIKCVTVCMRDWIFWPDSRCLPLTVFFIYIFSRVYVILWYYTFSIFISRDDNYRYYYDLRPRAAILGAELIWIFLSLNHQSPLCLIEINQIYLSRLFNFIYCLAKTINFTISQ